MTGALYAPAMSIAQLESPLHHPPSLVFLGNEAAGQPLAFHPKPQAKVNDRVREEAFIWTVAHELRQPLSAMTTAVAVVEHNSSPGATAHAIDVMGRQLRHMSRMVDDLLDAARLSTGKVSVIPHRLDIREVMTDAAADVAAEAAKRGQLLDVKCGAAPLWVNGDRQRLCQVFSNLLRNAIKFTGHGGRITFTADSHMSRIAVRVRDTGRGIDRQALPRIFDLFTQVQPSGLGGVGIGLSVAREIVSLHLGRIEAHSNGLGKGSEFEVTLPASPAGGS
jgi:signal transduction histidine kinase